MSPCWFKVPTFLGHWFCFGKRFAASRILPGYSNGGVGRSSQKNKSHYRTFLFNDDLDCKFWGCITIFLVLAKLRRASTWSSADAASSRQSALWAPACAVGSRHLGMEQGWKSKGLEWNTFLEAKLYSILYNIIGEQFTDQYIYIYKIYGAKLLV